MFILGQILHGFGAAPTTTLGLTFLDEMVSSKNSPLYIGLFQTWFVVGPAVGYILGGQLLTLHTDTDLSPLSPLWVGAWWPGFFVTFIGSSLVGLVILSYPRVISGHQVSHNKTTSGESSLLSSLRTTLTNPLYLFISLAVSFDSMLISGLSAFLPKFVQTQYQLSAGFSAQIVGILVVPSGAIATFLGGWIIKRMRLSRARILSLVCLVQAANTCLCLLFMLRCQAPELASLEVGAECNAGCGCEAVDVDLVCGSDGLMYLSPCLAGCSASSGQRHLPTFEKSCHFFTRPRKLHRLCLHQRQLLHSIERNL